MTALDRARQFVQNDALRTALVIVPLALCGAADAALVFDTSNGNEPSAVASTGLLDSESGQTSTYSPLSNGGARWWGRSNDFSFSSSGGATDPLACEFYVGDTVVETCLVRMTIGGTGSGSQGSTGIPAHWDFSLQSRFGDDPQDPPTGSITNIQYDIAFLINNEVVGTGSGASGDIELAGLSAGDLASWPWQVVLTASFEAFGSGTVWLDVPDNSVDIMPRGPSSVPEPGSLAIASVAFFGLAAVRRRRRA